MTSSGQLLAWAGALALGGAAPAAAQYYPGYSYGYPYAGMGAVGGFGYAPTRQIAINACAGAAQERLGQYGGGRVLGISDARPRGDGGMVVRGVASSGRYGYGYGYGGQSPVDLTWHCQTDYRGLIREVTIAPAQPAYGYNAAPWDDDFSRFGYRRY